MIEAVANESAVELQLYELLEEYMSLRRSGQNVRVRDFAAQHPEFRDQILADFPALLIAEGWKPQLSSTESSSPTVPANELPELLAGYRVSRQIGQGGMGIVYEAHHPELSRRLALKVLRPKRRVAKLTERFRREAEASARLSHPHIVPVYDFGTHGEVQYIAMPLIEGQNLDELLEVHLKASKSNKDNTSGVSSSQSTADGTTSRISGRSIPLVGASANFQSLAQLGANVASALAHAHGNKTIHRDIKPANLILDLSGKVWVTDFGLAKICDDDSDLSRTGELIGTPRYMAPEQMRGLYDERSDLYSLGVTLYEMASGQRAWESLDSVLLIKSRGSAELPELSAVAPYVPKPLAEIIMRACSFRPEDRYQTAEEMQLVLNRFAHGEKTGDRRRVPRHANSFLNRKWVLGSVLLSVPVITLSLMYAFNAGPWAPTEEMAQQALISLVEDETQREKLIDELPSIIESAVMSDDPEMRKKATNLSIAVVEEMLQRSEGTEEAKARYREAAQQVAEEVRSGIIRYDVLDHPLTNAIRNLDMARSVPALKLPTKDKAAAYQSLFSVGECIRADLISQEHLQLLLDMLPAEAQTGPTNKRLEKQQLFAFLRQLILFTREAIVQIQPDTQQYMDQLPDGGEGQLSTFPVTVDPSAWKGQSLPDAFRGGLEAQGIEIPKDLNLNKLKVSDDLKQRLQQSGIKVK